MALFAALATVIGTTILGSTLAATVATAIAYAVVSTAIGFATSAILGAVLGESTPEGQGASGGVRGTLQSGVVARSFLMGRAATAGSLVYANEWGEDGATPNAYLTMVIALSDLPIRALRKMWVAGEEVTILDGNDNNRGSAVEEYQVDGKNHLWVKFFDGNQTVADSFLVSKVSSSDRPWDETRIGRGVAYVAVTMLHNPELFSGIPQLLFECYGIPLFDPTDRSQDPDRPETWGGGQGDFNPAVQIFNILRGVRYRDEWQYGLRELDAYALPLEDWKRQIEICREDVDEADGAQRRYVSGGEVAFNTPASDTVRKLLTACQGRLADSAGRILLRCGPPSAPVGRLSDSDILSTSDQRFNGFEDAGNAVNALVGTHPDPDEGWTTRETAPVIWEGLVAQDGGVRRMGSVTLDYVHRPEQAARLLRQGLRDGRRERRHTISVGPEWYSVEPGDVIEWTSPRNGYDGKLFIVEAAADAATLEIVLQLREVDPADFDWRSVSDYHPAPTVWNNVRRPAPRGLVAPSATGVALRDGVKNRRPSIKLEWDTSNERGEGIEAVRWQVRLATDGSPVTKGRTEDVQDGEVIISDGIASDVDYEVRARPIMPSGSQTEWSPWLSVKAGRALLGRDDVDPEELERVSDDRTPGETVLTVSWETVDEIVVDRSIAGPVEVVVQFTVAFDDAEVRILEDLDLVYASNHTFPPGPASFATLRTDRPTSGETTFKFQARRVSGASSLFNTLMWASQKRRNS